jgi:hypothetical protein
MNNPVNEHPPEHQDSLWLLTAAPLIWVAHFLLCYLTAAIWCAKLGPADGSLAGVRAAIAAYTALALAGIGGVAWIGLRKHRLGSARTPHDFDTPRDRHRFLGFATLLLAGLSAVAVFYVSLAAVFIETCF